MKKGFEERRGDKRGEKIHKRNWVEVVTVNNYGGRGRGKEGREREGWGREGREREGRRGGKGRGRDPQNLRSRKLTTCLYDRDPNLPVKYTTISCLTLGILIYLQRARLTVMKKG